ncbi:MAG: amino acid adenylation domain-containing protein [Chlorobiaceae bacterium]|nr:amino acid adenylation domain-containing protein [Chlorobiaceae bacterium]NTV60796.1 amino acid adenylation domain-containing protein [Chlorobiaceae bacterium]
MSPNENQLIEDRIRLEHTLLEKRRKNSASSTIPRRNGSGPCEPSFAQARLWMVERIMPVPGNYNISSVFRIHGTLDLEALQSTLEAIIERHEVLRTRLSLHGGTLMQSVMPAQPFVMHKIDTRENPAMVRQKILDNFIDTLCRAPFDLSKDCMLRAGLAIIEDKEFIFAISIHHTAADAWSMPVLYREIAILYESSGKNPQGVLPPLPLQYADYALWQREQLTGKKLKELLQFWKTNLDGLTPLDLPFLRPRPATPLHRGDIERFTLSSLKLELLKSLARKHGISLYVLLLAVFQLLLSRYSGQDDISVGTPVTGRIRSDLEALIGFFVNTLVIRSDLGGNPSLRTLFERVRDSVLDGFNCMELPFELLVEEMNPRRDTSLNPLFQVMFTYYTTPEHIFSLPGLEVEEMPLPVKTVKFDLTASFAETGDDMQCSFTYDTDLFERGFIRRMTGHFKTLLDAILVHDPETPARILPMLTGNELELLTVTWNRTGSNYPRHLCIHQLFEAVAAQGPNEIALIFEDMNLSYGELNARANRLARHLNALGATPGSPVGISLPRSIDMVTGILAILKTGGTYVPLDPELPPSRLAFMLEDTGAAFVITRHAEQKKFDAAQVRMICIDTDKPEISNAPAGNFSSESADPEASAYIMYTSGSTGQPKGVAISHRNIARLVFGTDYISFGKDQTFLLLAPPFFDASTFELWGALLHGARCIIYPGRVPAAEDLENVINRYGVNTLWLTSALFNTVIDQKPQALRGLRQLITGGEALSATHVRRALDTLPDTMLVNGYGPTESTTFACCYRIPRSFPPQSPSVPIGRPIANTRVYVLDPSLQPVPIGVPGELYIGGDGLAAGYLHLEELTRERFLPDPFNPAENARIYRTGDRVRYLSDGNIEFLGRLDNQIKLRGYRIELEEIEAHLLKQSEVKQAVVVMREDSPGQPQLVAYAVTERKDLDAGRLHDALKKDLPVYMLPSAYVLLESLPLTQNGKLDRKSLPAPEDASGNNGSPLKPRNPIEQQLFDIWKLLLNRSSFGVRDNFFDAGGHSLLAVQMIDQIEKIFNCRIPLDTLWLSSGTIESLAEVLNGQYRFCINPELVEMKKGSGLPLFLVHVIGGHLLDYFDLVRSLDPDQSVYGLQARGVFGAGRPDRNMKVIAARCIEAMKIAQPQGPYLIAGFSSGGVIAYEMTQQLRRQGERIALLAMIDTNYPWAYRTTVLKKALRDLSQGHTSLIRNLLYSVFFRLFRLEHLPVFPIRGAHRMANMNYRPNHSSQPVCFFIAQDPSDPAKHDLLGWENTIRGPLQVYHISTYHHLILKPPAVAEVAEKLNQCIEMASNP